VAPRVTLRPLRYVFPVAGCETSYANGHHDYPAADIFADRGCRFVAPVDGTVEEVTRHDHWDPQENKGVTRGGRSVAIVGVDGVRYYGSHLERVRSGLAPGDQVHAGQLLGRVGDSGSAAGTGTHLHFGISWPTERGHWWVRRGAVLPQPYLDAWRHGRDLSPATAVRRAERREGRDVSCRAYC
jgi:murein DD-endopeptidase MepM/ murein hydrolase activator NlpD